VLPRGTYLQYYIQGDGHPSGAAFAKVADLLVSEVKTPPP
jgi:hypothetical protein